MRDTSSTPNPNRRTFLRNTAAGTAAAAAVNLTHVAHAAGSDTIRVGLVGCGGRGTGAAEQALTADPGCRLVAMAELFEDRLASSLKTLKNASVGDRVEVSADGQFVGFDAYKNVIDQVDVVILTTPPHFRPIHLAYAVEKGVHAFVEKPMAVDPTGLRQYLQACRDAAEKGLSVVHGFCWRYNNPRREAMRRVFDGQIGDIVAIETTYNSQGVWDPRKTREECSSEMEYQQRNWYYYTWLSGDHIVEQAVHGIDTMNWAMRGRTPIQYLRPFLGRLRISRERPGLSPLPPLAEHRQPGQGLHSGIQGDVRRLRHAARPSANHG